MAEINGICDERFKAVREALAESLDSDDVGASAAVYVDGEPVVDLWGGYADAARSIPWGPDTITNVWSTTKTMTALCALVLAVRGLGRRPAPGGPGRERTGRGGSQRRDPPQRWQQPGLAARADSGRQRFRQRPLGRRRSVGAGLRRDGAGRAAAVAGRLRPRPAGAVPRSDQILGASMRYGMGDGIFDRSCGWGGWGGSLVMVDLDARMAVSYVMNQMLDQGQGDYRGLGIVMAAYEGLP